MGSILQKLWHVDPLVEGSRVQENSSLNFCKKNQIWDSLRHCQDGLRNIKIYDFFVTFMIQTDKFHALSLSI